MANLNFHYFNGQTFDLDQATMNKMIADVHVLKAENAKLREALEDIANHAMNSFGYKPDKDVIQNCERMARAALQNLVDTDQNVVGGNVADNCIPKAHDCVPEVDSSMGDEE